MAISRGDIAAAGSVSSGDVEVSLGGPRAGAERAHDGADSLNLIWGAGLAKAAPNQRREATPAEGEAE